MYVSYHRGNESVCTGAADCLLYPGKRVWLSKNPYLSYACQKVISPALWRIVGARPKLTPHLGLGSYMSLTLLW